MKLRNKINFADGEVFETEGNLTLKLTKIPINKLSSMLSPKERKNEIDEFFVQGMANSLVDSSTQIIPIIVCPYEDTDRYLIIDGENQVQALKKNSTEEVLAIVVKGLTTDSAKLFRIFTRRHKLSNPKALLREIQTALHLTDDFTIQELEKIIGLKDDDYYLYDKLQTNFKYRNILRDLINGKITTNTAMELINKKDKQDKRLKDKQEKEKKNVLVKNAKSQFLENELEGKGKPKAFNGNIRSDILLKKVIKRDKGCFCCGKSGRDVEFTLHNIIPTDAQGQTTLDNTVALCIDCNARVEGYALDTDLFRKYNINFEDMIDEISQNILLLADITTQARLNNVRALKDFNEVLYTQVKNGTKSYLTAVKKLKNVKSILPKDIKPFEYVQEKRK